jgi:DNA-binding CsgD family transcriptional regulator
MARLCHQDFDACSRALRQLYGETSLENFPNLVLQILSELVPVEYATYNELTPRSKRFVIRYFPERPDLQPLVPQFAAHIQTHPLFGHYQRTGLQPRKISDESSLRQFRETAVYQEYYQFIGIKHQMIFSVKGGGETMIGLALSRDHRDFSERNRDTLNFVSPHITQAFHNARVAGEMAINLEQIGEGMKAINRAVILAEPDGDIRWFSPVAREWLAEFFPGVRESSPDLPAGLKRLLTEPGRSVAGGRQTFREIQLSAILGHRLVAHYGRTSRGRFLITLTRERERIDPATAASLGLTPREAEILFWISEAKGNQEMAAILCISPRTVHKHVEHLFAKLGVNSRFEAQRRGWELRRL